MRENNRQRSPVVSRSSVFLDPHCGAAPRCLFFSLFLDPHCFSLFLDPRSLFRCFSISFYTSLSLPLSRFRHVTRVLFTRRLDYSVASLVSAPLVHSMAASASSTDASARAITFLQYSEIVARLEYTERRLDFTAAEQSEIRLNMADMTTTMTDIMTDMAHFASSDGDSGGEHDNDPKIEDVSSDEAIRFPKAAKKRAAKPKAKLATKTRAAKKTKAAKQTKSAQKTTAGESQEEPAKKTKVAKNTKTRGSTVSNRSLAALKRWAKAKKNQKK